MADYKKLPFDFVNSVQKYSKVAYRGILSAIMKSPRICVTYVPADCGSVIPGKSKAPEAFQDANIVNKLQEAGLDVSVHHALDHPVRYSRISHAQGGVRNEKTNVYVCEKVQNQISENLREASGSNMPFQLILGGECSMSPGIIAAFWRHAESLSPLMRIGLIYIDADTDLNTPLTPGFTGTFAGMNMAHLLQTPGGLDSMKQFSQLENRPLCDESNTVFLGVNMSHTVNRPEHLSFLRKNNFKIISSSSLAADPRQSATSALKYLEDQVDIIIVHLDVDAIDPQNFPLANIPNYTGVEFEQMMTALRTILSGKKVTGLTIAEVNPDHDPELEMTRMLTDEIVDMLSMRAYPE